MGKMFTGAKILIFVFQLLLAANTQRIKKEMSLAGPFTPDEILQNWDVTADALLQISSIKLTTEHPGITGGIWSKNPNLSNNWEVQLSFRISGKSQYGGEGIAIWYTRDSKQQGPVFGSRDYFSGLGIFIDSVLDPDSENSLPYIYGIINNGSLRFLDSLKIGFCQAATRNILQWTKIAVSYSGSTLTVYIDNEGKNKWKVCFSSKGVHLPTAYRLGITASTDQFSDNHEIISFTALDLDDPNKLWEDRSGIIPFAENVLMPIHPSKEDLSDESVEFKSEDEENELLKELEEETRKEEQRRKTEERQQREEKEKQEKLQREKQQKEHKEAIERRIKEEKEKQLKEEKERQQKQERERQQKEEKERRQKEEKERQLKEEKERRQKEEKERQENVDNERQIKEEMEKRAKTKKEKTEKLRKETEEKSEKEETPPVPFIRKAIYVLGTLLILVIIIKVYKKYSVQRREAQHKRLY